MAKNVQLQTIEINNITQFISKTIFSMFNGKDPHLPGSNAGLKITVVRAGEQIDGELFESQ